MTPVTAAMGVCPTIGPKPTAAAAVEQLCALGKDSRLGVPTGVSTLAAELQLPVGSVGGHLRVLLDAGLLERRRAGREVLYRWSDAGSALVSGAA